MNVASILVNPPLSPRLAAAIKIAKSVKLTANDLLEQRASFVYGSLKPDASVTKDEIKEYIVKSQGGVTETGEGDSV